MFRTCVRASRGQFCPLIIVMFHFKNVVWILFEYKKNARTFSMVKLYWNNSSVERRRRRRRKCSLRRRGTFNCVTHCLWCSSMGVLEQDSICVLINELNNVNLCARNLKWNFYLTDFICVYDEFSGKKAINRREYFLARIEVTSRNLLNGINKSVNLFFVRWWWP